MEYVANYIDARNKMTSAAEWAQQREEEGFDVIACADHFWANGIPYPNIWVTLTNRRWPHRP